MNHNKLLDEALRRIEDMSIDQFEALCVKSGFSPIRKEGPSINVGTIGHIDYYRTTQESELDLGYFSGVDYVNYWAFVEEEIKSAILHIYPDINLTDEEDLCKIQSEFHRIDTPEAIHFCRGDKELVGISKNTTQANRYYGDNL